MIREEREAGIPARAGTGTRPYKNDSVVPRLPISRALVELNAS
jgi:hypothetical protein